MHYWQQNVCAMVAGHQGIKFSFLYYVCPRGQDAASISHHCANTNVVGHGRWTIWTMNKERIEIKLSKTKGILTFLGSVTLSTQTFTDFCKSCWLRWTNFLRTLWTLYFLQTFRHKTGTCN